MPATAKTARQV